jgi:hypothetical protein
MPKAAITIMTILAAKKQYQFLPGFSHTVETK